MKRIITVVAIFIFSLFLTGCTKNYKPITYTKFNEVFKDKNDFMIVNQTLKYQDRFERCIEASGKNIQFIYYEFKTEEEAREYLSENYKDRKKYRYKSNQKYSTVKCKDNMYFEAVQVDKIVLVGNSPMKANKKIIKGIFKELGY